jgi:hypothetical protein
MKAQDQLGEAYLLQAGLEFYRSLLQIQNRQLQNDVEFLESQIGVEIARSSAIQAQQEQVKLLHDRAQFGQHPFFLSNHTANFHHDKPH